MGSKFKKVSLEEFKEFVLGWPNELEYNVTTICEPPLGNYNDFTDGKVWPESMVAKISMDWLGPNGEKDMKGRKFWEYYILDE